MNNVEQQAREAICEVGRRVWTKDYVAANDGNISFRLDENRVLCTPTMISKGFMKPDDLVIVDLEGNQLAGHRRATSEIKIHLFLYQQRPDMHAVVHAHPAHATAFAITQNELPKGVLPEVEIFLGEIPVAPYATTGTWEFARSVAPWARTHDAFLLMSHGAVTIGRDPFDAYYKMETVDQYCRILMLARSIGPWRTLDTAAVGDLLKVKERLGIRDPRRPGELLAPGVRPTAGDPGTFAPYTPHTGPLEDSPKPGGARFTGA